MSLLKHFLSLPTNVKILSSVQTPIKIPHPHFVIQTLCILLARNNNSDKPKKKSVLGAGNVKKKKVHLYVEAS